MSKPVHAKPSLYAFYFESLKNIALKYGYNLVLHGSLNRDLDLIAIPWQEKIGSHEEMVNEFSEYLDGSVMLHNRKRGDNGEIVGEPYSTTHHGRIQYVVNINRECQSKHHDGWKDPQYYLDISVTPDKIQPVTEKLKINGKPENKYVLTPKWEWDLSDKDS